MERVVNTTPVRVDELVRRGDDEQAVRPQDALELAEHSLLLAEVLDRLEAHREVERSVRRRDLRAVAGAKTDVHRHVARRSMPHRVGIEIDADRRPCDQRQGRGAVTFTTRDVQDVLVPREFEHHRVAMEMLVVYLAAQLGDVALPCERHVHGGAPGTGV